MNRTVQWRLRDYLDRHDLTVRELIGASGLAAATIHAMAAGRAATFGLSTVGAVADGLEKLTGQPVSLGELLELADGPTLPVTAGWGPGGLENVGP